MFIVKKIESTIIPEKFQSLNNGIWYYNYDITEKTVMVIDDIEDLQEREETRYEYAQVRINGTPTFSKCYEAILKQYKNEQGLSLFDAKALGLGYEEQCENILYNVKVDFELEQRMTPLEEAKRDMIKKISEYDSSEEVNSFFLNGEKVWLNKDTRVGLMNSLTIEKNVGKEQSTLWFNDICVTINCDAAIQMLGALELYALECYNVTAQHKVTVDSLNNMDDVKNYDYTIGYPSKLTFTIE